MCMWVNGAGGDWEGVLMKIAEREKYSGYLFFILFLPFSKKLV